MKQKCFSPAAALLSCVFTLGALDASHAQLAYSTFTEGSVAYAALSGLGMDFSAANPAVLCGLPPGKRVAYVVDAINDDAFLNEFPNSSLQLALASRLTIAFAQTKQQVDTFAGASRRGPAHPLRDLFFGYQQDWAVGAGFQIKPALHAGLVMRHEGYLVVPHSLGPYSFWQQFRSFDMGFRKTGTRFNFGLVLRNLVKDRASKPYNQPVRIRIAGTDSIIVWNPVSFPGIAFEPAFKLEGGLHWLISSHWQLLADWTSRKEYAYGLRWRVFSALFITTGTGKRFDRIYDDEAVTYTTLGSQFQHKSFALGLTWIIPTRQGRTRFVSSPHGSYEIRQNPHHRLLIGLALSL